MCWQGLDTWDVSWINDLCIMGNLHPAVMNTECCKAAVKTLRPWIHLFHDLSKRPLWRTASQLQVRTRNTNWADQIFNKRCQYLLKLRISHHALQGVKDRVSLHRRQGLPCDFAGVVVLTLHFRGWKGGDGMKYLVHIWQEQTYLTYRLATNTGKCWNNTQIVICTGAASKVPSWITVYWLYTSPSLFTAVAVSPNLSSLLPCRAKQYRGQFCAKCSLWGCGGTLLEWIKLKWKV